MPRKQTDEIASGALAPGSEEQRRALLAGEWDFSKAAEATTPTWLLYEHADGRYAVAPSAQAATFAHGDPAWHRVAPVEVHGVLDALIEGITPENRHAEAWPAHSKSEYKRRVDQGDPDVLPPAAARISPEGWQRLAESLRALGETDDRIKELERRYGLAAGVRVLPASSSYDGPWAGTITEPWPEGWDGRDKAAFDRAAAGDLRTVKEDDRG